MTTKPGPPTPTLEQVRDMIRTAEHDRADLNVSRTLYEHLRTLADEYPLSPVTAYPLAPLGPQVYIDDDLPGYDWALRRRC